MLLSFSVSNFRSFHGEQTLSLVASSRQPDHPDHLTPIAHDENKALSLAVLYGANGAGKSNLVKALRFLQDLVREGTEPQKQIHRATFALHGMAANEPTGLRIQFQENGRVYAFGVKVDDRVVLEEWLSIVRHGREISVYERVTREDDEVEIEAGEVLKDEKTWGLHDKVTALVKVGALPNQLFLSTVLNTLKPRDQGDVLSGALKWFVDRLVVIPPDASYAALPRLIGGDSSFAEFASIFLRKVATGIDRLAVKSRKVKESSLEAVPEEIRHTLQSLSEGDFATISTESGNQLHVEKNKDGKFRILSVQAEHVTQDGKRIHLPFSEESDGTQRLTHLLPALHSMTKENHRVYVIDEIDRSLHPLLAKGFVRAFLQTGNSGGSQLICTTHELAFMDLDLLRRDEIWFASKKLPEGCTELYSLADYKVRTDLKIDKAYLQGRFEAIPPIEEELPGWVQDIMKELAPSGESVKAEGAV